MKAWLRAEQVRPLAPERCRIDEVNLDLQAGQPNTVLAPDAYLGGMLIGLLSGRYRIGHGSVQLSSSLGVDELAGMAVRRLAGLRAGPLAVVGPQLPISPAATGAEAVALLAGSSQPEARRQLAELDLAELGDQQLGLLAVNQLTMISLAAALASPAEILLCDLDGVITSPAAAALNRRAEAGAAVLAVSQLPCPALPEPILNLTTEGKLR